jgi:hypothetical protein
LNTTSTTVSTAKIYFVCAQEINEVKLTGELLEDASLAPLR